jgi:hypothetical protein
MIEKPAPVPKKEITSIDVPNFASGLNLNGAQNAQVNAFIDSKDVAIAPDGCLIPRPSLVPFLPDTVDVVYQIYPIIWGGVIYYVTADRVSLAGTSTAGQIVYCKEGDTSWTIAGAATGSTNTATVLNGGKPEFIRALDTVIVMNGDNGDKVAFLDLSTTPFKLRQEVPIADPTVGVTITASGGITGSTTNAAPNIFPIYFAYSYTTATGETNLSPILTYYTSDVRDHWLDLKTTGGAANPGKLAIVRPNTAPVGAQNWNLYISLAAVSGAISSDNMLQLAPGLDLGQTTFIDDGSLGINLGQPAPNANTTDGPRISHGIVEEGNPILFGDVNVPSNIWIGGGGVNALSFSSALGGYKAQPNLGTNFQVTQVIGFRNGQGIPSLTVLFSNTQGLAEQAVLQQQTVNYGGETFTVWGVTSQHYGAAGVAAADSAVNYNGKLVFMGTDGLMSMNTQPLRQNVIATYNLTIKTLQPYVGSIKNSAMSTIVGTAWDNRFMWTMPTGGFDTPQQILIMDDNNQVPQNDNNGAFYTYDIPTQWIDVVSPANEAAFIYVVQGNHSYKLQQATATFDTKAGVPVPFSCYATGSLVSMGPPARNHWQADVQAMFYVMGLVGSITVGVTYRNQNGKLKTKTKTYNGPAYVPTKSGGWGDPQYTYAYFPAIPGWGRSPMINTGAVSLAPLDIRIPVQIDDITNEAQWFFTTDTGFNNFKFKAVSFEGINLGVRPDLQ